jgi:release factor glutamine methyltransferase
VETAVSMFERKSKFNVLDIGTGSGCILLSILHEFPNASGLGVDVSSEALKVATENSQRLKLNHRASFVQRFTT